VDLVSLVSNSDQILDQNVLRNFLSQSEVMVYGFSKWTNTPSRKSLAVSSAMMFFFQALICWVCVIFFACVCVGASDTTTASDGPYKLGLCRCTGRFLGGSQGGGRYAPPWLRAVPRVRAAFGATPRNFFLGGFLLFLADFAIFS
jgi:hypothetical protein